MNLYELGKRLIDIVGALCAIILFSPIMLLTAIHIKRVSSKGPVLADTPMRVGKNGEEFRMYKFRSMIPNAYEWLKNQPELYKKYKDNNYKLNAEEDPRIIPGGIFIRKSSIDELPQFFNVLQGNMSIVGPRAYYPFELKEQAEKAPETLGYINQALSVKPGITGVWQISGRSAISFIERVKLDAEYAKHKSILYDLLIILKTPYVVLTKKGAM